MDKHSVHEYLNDYISSFNIKLQTGGMIGGAISTQVTDFINAGDFRSVIDYFFVQLPAGSPPAPDHILNMTLKTTVTTLPSGKAAPNQFLTRREEFILNQVAIVTAMLAKVQTAKGNAPDTTVLGPYIAPPGGFLADIFNSMYGGQNGGMIGGLPARDALPRRIDNTTTIPELYTGILGVAAHVEAVGSTGPITSPTITAPAPTITAPAPTITAPAPITGPKIPLTLPSAIDFVECIRLAITAPDLKGYNTFRPAFNLALLLDQFNSIEDQSDRAVITKSLRSAIIGLPKVGITKQWASNLGVQFTSIIRNVLPQDTIKKLAISNGKSTTDLSLFISAIRAAILTHSI